VLVYSIATYSNKTKQG